MKKYKEYISEISTFGLGTQSDDITGLKKLHPKLITKKKKVKLSAAQRLQHRKQKDNAKRAAEINKITGDVSINENRNFTIVNKFGGVKYKNITMAHHDTTQLPTNVSIPVHHNYMKPNPVYISNKDIAGKLKSKVNPKPKIDKVPKPKIDKVPKPKIAKVPKPDETIIHPPVTIGGIEDSHKANTVINPNPVI